jgi:Domain of unknown function (DUF1906)
MRRSTLIALLLALGVAAAPAAAGAQTREVHFRGQTVAVPASWPVFRLAAEPRRCVRLDRRAVYLGRPGTEQRCPAQAIGRPRAILIQPRAGGVSVSRARDREVTPTPSPPPAKPAPLPRAGATASYWTGLGFDACSAPSTTALAAWLSSPYRGLGVYIGGLNRGCSQPNLNSTWVASAIASGWQLIPTYVGLQAPGNGCGCASISSSQAGTQGTAAADDAVAKAAALGIGPGNPIYFDMESYTPGGSATTAVLTFLGAWTAELHNRGYVSGVYGSSGSTISDLVDSYGIGSPDDIWFAHWNNQQSTADPAYIPSTYWANHQRLHQYRGGHNETYGGVTINIDNDFLDGATVGTASAPVVVRRRSCPKVVFKHRPVAGAFKIRAFGESQCSEARGVAGISRQARFAAAGSARRYLAGGFTCRGHRVGRAGVVYGCKRPKAQIRFLRKGTL